MMPKRKIEKLAPVVEEDPAKVAWIDAHMERARPKQPPKKRRPSGGRVVHMWVNSEQQAQLSELAEREQVSLNVAAKRVLEQALNGLDTTS
jgi:predicted HicB family RNase H-like nuclease